MKNIKYLLCIVPLLVSGCMYNPFSQDELPKENIAFASNYLNVLINGKTAEARSYLSEELYASDLSWLDEVSYLLNQREIKSNKIVYQKIISESDPYRTAVSYEIQHPGPHWLVTEIVMDKRGDSFVISGLHIYPLAASFEEQTSFTFNNKSFVHYLMIAAVILVISLTVIALILCIRTKLKMKWLWIPFILFGLTKIGFVWTTAAFEIDIFYIQLLSAGLGKETPYDSYILSISIPLGAILFLIKRKAVLKSKPEEVTPAVETV